MDRRRILMVTLMVTSIVIYGDFNGDFDVDFNGDLWWFIHLKDEQICFFLKELWHTSGIRWIFFWIIGRSWDDLPWSGDIWLVMVGATGRAWRLAQALDYWSCHWSGAFLRDSTHALDSLRERQGLRGYTATGVSPCPLKFLLTQFGKESRSVSPCDIHGISSGNN